MLHRHELAALLLILSACGRTGHLGAHDAAPADGAPPDAHAVAEARPADAPYRPGGTWIQVKPGAFFMGSPTTEACRDSYDERQHMVALSRGFEIWSTEVTRGEYRAAMGYDPSASLCIKLDCPVDRATWSEAAAYCNSLSAAAKLAACYTCKGSGAAVSCTQATKTPHTCRGYRLPTEAEYEYALRAGSTSALHSGTIKYCHGADKNADKIGWYDKNAGGKPHPVAGKAANAWGIFDMSGNVGEWCSDWYAPYGWAPKLQDPVGPAAGTFRVVRFGSYVSEARTLRSASRSGLRPHTRSPFMGFRCVRTR